MSKFIFFNSFLVNKGLFDALSRGNNSFLRCSGVKYFSVLILLMMWSGESWGQVSMSTTSAYTQDFNTLANTGTGINWIDNSTIPNWNSQRTGNGNNYSADNGSGTGGTLYSYGTASNSDRALGTIGSNNAAAGSFAHGVLLKNTSGSTITDVRVTYTLEQWRKSGVTAAQIITFYYKISSSAITSLNTNSNSGWTQVAGLTLNSPVNTTTGIALDGNASGNKVTATNISIPSLSLANNEYIMLKWEDPDHSGSDHGLAIDDVTINWTVPVTNSTDATLSSLALSAGTLTPWFTSGNTTYSASVSNAINSITVTPTRNQANAIIQARVNSGSFASVTSGSASDLLTLNVGDNTIDVEVTAQDGTTKRTYTITVARGSSVGNPTAFTATTTSASQINLSTTANGSNDDIVVIYNGTGTFTIPTNGSAPTAVGTILAGSGGAIVYAGTAASLENHTSLNTNTSYYYKAFSYNSSNIYSGGITANATTAKIEPTNQPASIRISTWVTTTSMPIIWDAASAGSQAPDGYLVKLSSSTISVPVDGNDPGVGSTSISSGATEFKTTGTGATFTNAVAGTMYNVKIYSYTNSGSLINFNNNSVPTFFVATQPNQVTSGSITATGSTSADITWTAANDYNNSNHSTLVFVKSTNSITTGSPFNSPVAYNASSVFGAGTAYQNDAAATCVYNGDETSVSVTGLSPNTTYHVLIYTVVDATNSNSKNAYSSATFANGTTNNLSAPIATTATGNSTSGFIANWNAISGANEYKLDVSTTNFQTTTFTETFTGIGGGATSSYLTRSWTGVGGVMWTGYKVRIDQVVSPENEAITLQDAVAAYIVSDTINGNPTSIAFEIKQIFTGNGGSVILKLLSGTNFSTVTTIGTYNYTTIVSSITASISGIIGPFKIQIDNGNTSARPCIDNLSIQNEFFTGVAEYNNLSVSGISQPVNNLSPSTTYYYRVRAVGGNSTSGNSNTVTASTLSTFNVTGSSDASAFPLCPTCDVTITSGGTLNINSSKTFNSVTVAPGGKLTLANGKTLTAAITLQSTALGTGTFVDENIADVPTPITGTVEQYLTTGRNWYVSMPVTAGTTAALSTASSVQYWNELIGDWATLNSGATLDPSRGYISVATNQTKAITFSGTLNSGKKEIALTRTTGKTKEGFNLVGNPYPSYLNWTADIATAANVLPTIWYRTKPESSSYTFYTYNAEGVVGVPTNALGIIPPMQAFWVRANAGGGTLTLNNTMRTHGSGSNLLKAPVTVQPLLRLQLNSSLNSDETVVYFNSKALNEYDSYDSPKMAGSNSVSEIYTLAGSEELVINGMKNYTLDSEIPLGFRPGTGSGFRIKATEFSNFDSNIHVFLKDANSNNVVDITDTEYPISDATASTNRFSIIFKTISITTDLDTDINQQIVISKNANNQITVNCDSNQSYENLVTIYNAIGQKLMTKKITSPSTVLSIPNGSGVYLVTVINAGNKITQKVILD